MCAATDQAQPLVANVSLYIRYLIKTTLSFFLFNSWKELGTTFGQ